MRREVCWERMFPDELESAFRECPVAYLPYGLCEPHGPQSALGMDALRAHNVLRRTAQEYGGIVAPPEYWNVHDLGIYSVWAYQVVGETRPWLTAVPPWIFFKNVCYHIRTVDSLGFHVAILFTGHSGPHGEDIKTMVEILQPHFATRLVFFTDGDLMSIGAGHGGKVETSLLWAVEPDCVDVSRAPEHGLPEPRFAMGEDAKQSDRRLGEKLIDEMVANVGAKAKELLEEYDRLQPSRQPLTYDQIEQVWDRDVKPRFSKFASMQSLGTGQKEPPENSRWHAQWQIPDRS
jgi:creatinine amidohydrolase